MKNIPLSHQHHMGNQNIIQFPLPDHAQSRQKIPDNPSKTSPKDYTHFVIDLVTKTLNVERTKILIPTRSKEKIALARQIASYLMHVTCQSNISKTAAIFKRDRSTITYACRKIENKRDNPNFDYMIDHLEAVIKLHINNNQTQHNIQN